jgi:inosine/xanthosine triphosphate pyrophosphatase family protein/dephospho-CoA kinase
MRDLTFFTTNPTKLAHARYIAEGCHIRIKGFRQQTYHAEYVEPRLQSRDAILKASYESAKVQFLKAGFSDSIHPFVLEDTSVRIYALSRTDEEVPGVDIKYWMEGRTFASLDAMLRAAGNDRRATVRSDVLLHIPSNYRTAWGVQKPFMIFTGEQHGSIVETEHNFDANPVYPWLDNRSFNKWFVPDGSSAPLGSLSITVADKVDFRRKSFEQLFNFLGDRGYLAVPVAQMQLQLDRKPNVILCGYTCSGKTTASQHLARSFGYLHVEASDFMHLSYYHRHGYKGPIAISDFAERALVQKPTIAAEKVVEYLLENLDDPIVISGFRAAEEIAFLEKEMKIYGKHFEPRFICANEDTRFERLQIRARPGDDLTIEEFRARDLQQDRMGLKKIYESDEVTKLENNDNLNCYLEHIDRLIGNDIGHEIDIDSGLASLASTTNVGLQEAILIALLSVWKNDEARQFFTTTEVSSLIASVFPGIRPKHKDNVSRYFNQDYYAYYEISSSANGDTRKYRLSNTGYGMAIRALRVILKFQDS